MKTARLAIAAALAISLLGFGSTSVSAASLSVKTGTTSAGKVLVASTGKTLYVFAADSPGKSACSGACAKAWPPVLATAKTLAHSADVKAKLSVIKRSDGKTQLAVNGMPVYTFSGDTAAGQAHGQGMNASGGLWWVISPSGAAIKTAASGSGSGSGTGTSPGGTASPGGGSDYYY